MQPKGNRRRNKVDLVIIVCTNALISVITRAIGTKFALHLLAYYVQSKLI